MDIASFKVSLDAQRARITAATRPAAQAAAQVIYEQARLNVRSSRKGHWFHGTSFKKTGQKYWFDAGTLHDSIYQAFSKDHSGENRATYHVSWNNRKAPYGAMVEFGTSRAPAHSFLGKAITEVGNRASEAMKSTFLQMVRSA